MKLFHIFFLEPSINYVVVCDLWMVPYTKQIKNKNNIFRKKISRREIFGFWEHGRKHVTWKKDCNMDMSLE